MSLIAAFDEGRQEDFNTCSMGTTNTLKNEKWMDAVRSDDSNNKGDKSSFVTIVGALQQAPLIDIGMSKLEKFLGQITR